MLVLYASETGNAQDCAELIGRQAKARGLSDVRVLAADTYLSSAIDRLPREDVLVCVASTTGQGEFPNNGRAFWKYLRRRALPADLLGSVRCAVFGLGDSGYPKYNYCAKLLSKRFETLGGRSVVPLGLGDDQHAQGYDASLDLWLPKLWESLGASAVVDAGALALAPSFDVEVVGRVSDMPWLATEVCESVGHSVRRLEAPDDDALRARVLRSAEVVANARVTPPDWFQDTRLLTLEVALDGSGVSAIGSGTAEESAEETSESPASASAPQQSSAARINPGDVVGIWPRQDADAVRKILGACNLRYDDAVRVRTRTQTQTRGGGSRGGGDANVTCSAGGLLEGLVDVQGAPPRRTFIQAMAQLCPGDEATAMYKDRLVHLSSAQGREDFYEYVMQEGRNLVEVLADFSCVPMTLEWILSFAPRLQCRLYSMASVASEVSASPGISASPGVLSAPAARVDILAAMVQWKTPGRRLRRGLCSKTIAALAPGDRITVHLASGDLKPPLPSVPMILVGPGTGIAPLRSFLQFRRLQKSQARGSRSAEHVAPSVLFFGCRDRTKDFYFADEWRDMVDGDGDGGVLREVILATSRESTPKRYVQNVIKEQGKLVSELILEQGAHVYVCGRADSMPGEVERVLAELLDARVDVDARKKLLKRRLHVECW